MPAPTSPDHGTTARYAKKCRCDECKAANTAYFRDYREKNREAVQARMRLYVVQNAEKIAKQQRDYYLLHAQEIDARRDWRAYYKANKEKHAERVKRWNASPAGQRVRAQVKAARRGVPYTDEALDYIQVIRNDPCSYCGGPGGSVDHIEPISRGGSGDWDNLASACISCNSSKGAKPLLMFLLTG